MIRRAAFFAALFLFVVAAAPAAFGAKSATDTIRQTVDNVLNIIKKPEMHDPAKKTALLKDVEEQIKTIFDFGEFSARTVGPKWRTFTPDQQRRFEDAFASLLRATYIEKLEGYSGEKVNFTGEIVSTKGDKVEVQSSIQMKDNKVIPVSYRLLDKNGLWKVYDVRIENVSLIENYRGQFKDLLLKGSAEDLIKQVEEKARTTKNENNTVKR
ncbi:Toluene tolerance, Ttg2 family protein [uncultured delta proteobacterium]|uniref:Toluene tolerance, Ttg2 family protein n=1 Tax=uncultured delta proteobacterium TaxID=34034 RepID=A0A212J761_9DELT|nr:Toluene tolerance, Ttg2 family protein [uncultured delta proteobacterium]